MRLKDRVIIVTGGAGAGIGQSSARRFAEEGARIVLSDAHEGRAHSVAATIAEDYGVETIGVPCDVRERQQVEDLVAKAKDRFGRIDGLMNNAGINVLTQVVDMTDEQWDLVLDVCLRGTFYCCRAVLPTMIEQSSGSIVSLASTAGLSGSSGSAHYGAAKAGIIGFTKSAAREVAEYGVRLNCIAPGLIMNPFLERIYPKEDLERYLEASPLKRNGEPLDIANAALFLMCDEGSYLTGQTLSLSGGSVMLP
jgi:3-oxoacyl-[acyl-carrier protein] reductase